MSAGALLATGAAAQTLPKADSEPTAVLEPVLVAGERGPRSLAETTTRVSVLPEELPPRVVGVAAHLKF